MACSTQYTARETSVKVNVDIGIAGKIALVTGASGGIGRAVAESLAEEGALVVVTDLHGSGLEELEACPGELLIVEADLREAKQIADLFEIVEQETGGLDILVNNAGIRAMSAIKDTALEEWEEHLAVNTTSALLAIQHAIPMMRRRGGGSIINVASVAALIGYSNRVSYGASKAALVGLTQQAGIELAPLGIRVNAIAPGFTDTPLNRYNEQVERKVLSAIPMGRRATPGEIAAVVAFLAGDGARYITATTIVVDGGMIEGLLIDAEPWRADYDEEPT